MKTLATITLDNVKADYTRLLADSGCEVRAAENTGQFARHIDLYLDMLSMQLSYDALRIIGFDAPLKNALAAEMTFARDLANAGKIAQGRFVAVRR